MASQAFLPVAAREMAGAVSLTVLLLGVLLAGCGTSSSTMAPRDARGVERQLRISAGAWDGTPHRWGGTTSAGVDCSGLVQAIFEDHFQIALPRTTEQQVRVGERVRASRWAPGDLVFFKTGRKTRHVGIYLGRGEFLHASSSQGVTTSRLEDPYWTRTYWTARRVLPPRPAERATHASRPSPTATPPAASRAGW